ncbi:glycoside hydrolase family 55 protein [Priestia flexa]|uniref:glycoside hydrolase family 55 protein n=1 Tax=Priestia flexa TaxID=86664 RepID=UPI001CFE91AA|nr:glycoside hydrolase family 55 protein [Priestia flexa]
MPVEKISHEESLFEGTDKLNASIEQSNSAISEAGVAKNTANQAVSTSQEAVTKAESVQAQFNQVVIEGDSSVEAAQARVDVKNVAHPTLKARADSDYNEVTAQLAEITLNVKNYGAKGDNLIDDTIAIQNAFNAAKASGSAVVQFEANKHYKISNKIYVTQSDLTIDFNGATIHWLNDTNITNGYPDSRESYVGAFEIKGERIEPTKVDVQEYTTVWGKAEDNSTSNTQMGRFKVSDTSNYRVGDNVYIHISLVQQPNSDYSSAIPGIRTHAKVMKIDSVNKMIFTDFWSPFDFWGNRTFIPQVDHMVKLNAIKNVTVKNYTFVDDNPQVKLDFQEPPLDQAKYQVSGIVFNYGEGFTLENYHAVGTHFSALETYGSRNITVRNGGSRDCKWNASGKGYGIHFHNSMNIYVENWHCQNVRHTVDFSSCSFGTVVNSSGKGHEEFSFTLHGEAEHKITYINCDGGLKVGHGVLYFMDLDAEIKVDNCNISELKISWCDGLYIENSRAKLTGSAYHLAENEMHLGKTFFKNSVISIINTSRFIGENRGNENFKPILSFEKCEITGLPSYRDSSPNHILIDKFDQVLFSNNFSFDLSNIPAYLNVKNNNKFVFKNNNCLNLFTRYTDNTEISFNDVYYEGNTFTFNDGGAFTPLANGVDVIRWYKKNSIGKMIFRENTYNLSISSANKRLQPMFINGVSTDFEGSKMKVLFENETYNLLGSQNVDVLASECLDIVVTVKNPAFNKYGAGSFIFGGKFNLSETELINGCPTVIGGVAPTLLNKPRAGQVAVNLNPRLGEAKSQTWNGTSFIPDLYNSVTVRAVNGTSVTIPVAATANKRGMFTVMISAPFAAYCTFISTGTSFTVINKTDNFNVGSVLENAVNIESVNGDIRITNNLGSDRDASVSCVSF